MRDTVHSRSLSSLPLELRHTWRHARTTRVYMPHVCITCLCPAGAQYTTHTHMCAHAFSVVTSTHVHLCARTCAHNTSHVHMAHHTHHTCTRHIAHTWHMAHVHPAHHARITLAPGTSHTCHTCTRHIAHTQTGVLQPSESRCSVRCSAVAAKTCWSAALSRRKDVPGGRSSPDTRRGRGRVYGGGPGPTLSI